MSSTVTALEAHHQIESFAKEAPTEMRFVPDGMKHPHWIRQGDIYIEAVNKLPLSFDQETSNKQLAPGENRGSRHVVEGDVKVFLQSNPSSNDFSRDGVLSGPALVAKDRFKVTHPEHAHFSLPAGTYRVYYQMDARQAERTRSLD